jgi:hypothetical protein
MISHQSKAKALAAARKLRAQGQVVKVHHHSGVYCQPGRGIASYSYYIVSNV